MQCQPQSSKNFNGIFSSLATLEYYALTMKFSNLPFAFSSVINKNGL